MFETQERLYFPPLPFDREIPYFCIDLLSTKKNFIEDLSSNDTSDLETEVKMECSDNSNNYILNQNINKDIHKSKSPIQMNENAANFKFSFYKLLTSKKKFQKKYVVQIHNAIHKKLQLRKVNREESRSIDLYFVHFSPHADKILMCIQQNKPELIQILRQN